MQICFTRSANNKAMKLTEDVKFFMKKKRCAGSA